MTDDLDIPAFLRRGDAAQKAVDAAIAKAAPPAGKKPSPAPAPTPAENGVTEVRKSNLKTKPAARAKPAQSAERRKLPRGAGREDGLRAGSKVAQVVDLVCRGAGATCEECANKIGWKVLNRSTLERYCKQAHVKLRVEDAEGKPPRFFGTPKK